MTVRFPPFPPIPKGRHGPTGNAGPDGRHGPAARAIREQVASAVNLIVHITRLRDGTRRVPAITRYRAWKGT